jgi:hypothetical protein
MNLTYDGAMSIMQQAGVTVTEFDDPLEMFDEDD